MMPVQLFSGHCMTGTGRQGAGLAKFGCPIVPIEEDRHKFYLMNAFKIAIKTIFNLRNDP